MFSTFLPCVIYRLQYRSIGTGHHFIAQPYPKLIKLFLLLNRSINSANNCEIVVIIIKATRVLLNKCQFFSLLANKVLKAMRALLPAHFISGILKRVQVHKHCLLNRSTFFCQAQK